MANVNFKNLPTAFSMWNKELDPNSVTRASDYLYLQTKTGHGVVLSGHGLGYSGTGVPARGEVDRVYFAMVGSKSGVPDIDITDVHVDFADYANLIASNDPIVRTNALWNATLAGNDSIDFGVNPKRLQIVFAGDGYAPPPQAYGGDDVFTGSVGDGIAAGDYINAGQNQIVFGGNDTMKLTSDAGSMAVGDVYTASDMTTIVGGDDYIQTTKAAYVYGDVFDADGFLQGGNDTIVTGNSDDYIAGDAYTVRGNSTFRGGNDLVHAGGGNDTIFGDYYNNNGAIPKSGGHDRLYGESGSDSIHGNEGNDYIDGGADGDSLFGDEGNDVVRGGTGQDSIYGGAGIDVADYSDRSQKIEIRLNANGGGPVEVGGVAEDYLDSIENIFGGSAGDLIVGYSAGGDNLFDGRGGNDSLHGGAGRDVLIGGGGADKLTGGSEADQFRFNVALGKTNIDRIVDFVHGTDEIALDDAIFKALGATFSADEFVAKSSGHVAASAAQHIIYDKSNGTLWYDSDGKGGHAAVQFAQLGTSASHPTNLTWGDFAII